MTTAPTVVPGGTVTVTVRAHDPDCTSGTCASGCGTYVRADLTAWSSTAGLFTATNNGTSASPYAASADWQAPTAEGTYSISVTLADSGTSMCGGRKSVTGQVNVLVTASTNRPPVVDALTAAPTQLYPGQTSTLNCSASDPDGDPVTYTWSADAGALTPSGASATFVGSRPGIVTVTCTATDSRGVVGSGTVRLSLTDALAESRIPQNLAAPQRIALDSMGDIYVADRGSGGIAALNLADGALVYRLALAQVASVAADWQDRLLVGDAAGARVLDRSGRAALVLDPGEQLGAVADVAVDRAHRRYAVLHNDTGRVVVYDEFGARIAGVGSPGDGPAEFRRPQGLAFTPQGDVVVADSGHAMIKVLGLDGTLRLAFGGNGTSAGKFVRLDDVEVDANGIIYASDAYQAWIQSFDADGTLREVIGTYGDKLGQFKTPAGIVASSTYRRLIVASLNSSSVEIFRMSGDAPPARLPQAALSAAALGFAARPVGTVSPPQTVTLGNIGSAPLGIRRVVVSGDFAQSNDCGSFLDPGKTCAFSVAYAPETPGTSTGSLAIETSANPSLQTVALSGEAFVPAAASLSPTHLDFADQRVGTTSAPQTITLSNTGGLPLSILGIDVSQGFGVAHGCGGVLPVGGSCVLNLYFAPVTAGPVTGALTVQSNAANGAQLATLAGRALPRCLKASPEELDFGKRPVRSRSKPETVTLTNTTNGPVGINAVQIAGAGAAQFLVQDDDCSGEGLAGGGSCRVRVVFRPEGVGEFSARVQVTTGTGDRLDLVALSGVGVRPGERKLIFRDDFESGDLSNWTVVVPPEPTVALGTERPSAHVDFGRPPVGGRRSKTFKVVNPQDKSVAVEEITVGGEQGDRFHVEEDDCSGTQLRAGGSCIIRVVFEPLEAGPATAEIEVVSSVGRDSLGVVGQGRRRPERER